MSPEYGPCALTRHHAPPGGKQDCFAQFMHVSHTQLFRPPDLVAGVTGDRRTSLWGWCCVTLS